ncbi:insulinase family protein [Undibacterium sp. RTI2.1]|uniref:M16 family metallopeptidase n=1 Tax=unclassified Undibacterium TaxID=2630295 RepID=UPI002AB35AEC|nr:MULTISPECIES: insulinase family protein [unclassified Undibacterium]MDY7540599.1 insulinase family protein [Undibacterium sp. 5I1]MEB0029737.1 insulinase family protein [Undibacterium sp. RTI2.1]MEB0117471.1 insulinase family protein [Undibacterium sp. RTI2.2]MEB0230776.1 insulinase family protein [Undibacterium sp. 10I3]MEB0256565.1 insulinase family protein [Undibacterium sp. 5I1]
MIKLMGRTVASVFFLTLSWSAHATINLTDPIPVGPQVKVGKLPNGLTYYIQKNAKPEKRVELRLVVKAGSILEDDDQQGLAHFTEHMAFNGSRHFKKHELISYLQSIGVKFGADLNAYTSFDETVYILQIPTDKKENLETGFQVLEDWAQGVQMNDADIDKERDIILEEARLGKGANDRMNKVLLPGIFNGSKYADRLPIGKEDIIKNFKYDAVKRFYADWYRPDLMAVVVVGDIEPEQAEKMVLAHFAQLKNPAKERPRDYAKIPDRAESKALVITDKEATSNIVLIRYPVRVARPNVIISDYRQSMIKRLAASMLGQRMQELTQQATPPFLGASSSMGQLVHGYESFSSVAALGSGGVEPAINAVVQENERARQFGFSADELDRAKKTQLRNLENSYNERDKSNSGMYAAEYIRNFLDQETIPGIVNEYAYNTELMPGITLSEVNMYVSKSIPAATQKLVAYMGSSKTDVPAPLESALLQMVITAEKMPVVANEQKKVASNLMERPQKSGSIISEKYNKELDLTELTLSNGVKVVLKSTDFKNDQVLISTTRFGGQSLYENKDNFNARYASSIVSSMGLKTFSSTDIPKILAGKSANLQTSSGFYTEGFSGSAGSADVETLFQLLSLRMTSPRKDEELFKSYIKKGQDATKNTMASPESIFNDALITTLYNNHPRSVRSAKPEDFSQIDLDRSMAIFNDRFSSAKGLTFIIVGSFEIDKIKPLITAYLANLPTSEIVTTYKDLGMHIVTGVVKKEVRVGTEQNSRVVLNFSGAATYSKEENMRFHAMLDVLNLRITDILREKLTLIYGGGMGGSINRIPDQNYRIGVTLPCGPENVDKVIAAMFAEIQQIKTDGPLLADLNKVKQNWLKERQIQMRTNTYWLGNLQDSILYGTDMAEMLGYEARVNAVTLDDIKQAANRYFNLNNYVQFVMYPEK